MLAIPRMLRIGIAADARLSPAVLAVLPSLVRTAGLDSLWLSDRAPIGPLPDAVAISLVDAAWQLRLRVRRDAEVATWRGGPPPAADTVFVPAWPHRRLPEVLGAWAAAAVTELVVEVPVSIGRTRAEAEARMDTRIGAEPWFAAVGDPAMDGLYGSLEDGQEEVAALAGDGVGELCCLLPPVDLPDVIAQLSALAVGSVPTHGRGTGRSTPPPPPAGWGRPRSSCNSPENHWRGA